MATLAARLPLAASLAVRGVARHAASLDLTAAVLLVTGELEPEVAPGALLVEDILSATVAALGSEIESGTGEAHSG